MKLTALITTLFTTCMLAATTANAILPSPGRFVPTQCGPQTMIVEFPQDGLQIHKVCLGEITGAKISENDASAHLPAVSLVRSNGTERLFRVVRTTSESVIPDQRVYRMSYELESIDGLRAVIETTYSVDGALKSATGVYGNSEFSVPEFQHTIQAL